MVATPTAVRAAVVVLAVLASLVVRVVVESRAELLFAEAQLAAGERDVALVHFRRAARWYAPGSPYHVRALEALGRMGQQARAAGDVPRALDAYRSVRGAILAARSFYTPETERLHMADAQIAELMAGLPPPGMDRGKGVEQLRAEHLALLQERSDPDTFWTLLALLGFLTWVGAAFAMSFWAIDAEQRWVPATAKRWGALVALGMGLFVTGLALA